MPLSSWPAITDDSSTGTDGTPVDKAWADAVRASVEDALYNNTNPTIDPAAITDEVVDARSTFDTLGDRLDDLQSSVIQSVSSDPTSLATGENVVRNGDLVGWRLGSALAPDQFTLSGGGASVARATGLGSGPFAARITYGAEAAKLTQILIDTAEWADQSSLGTDGRILSLAVRISASLADQARIVVSDGVTVTESGFHTGSGNPETIRVSHPISGSATKLEFYCEVAIAGSADFSGFMGSFTDAPPISWQPAPRYGHRVLHINVTPVGNVGAGTDDLMSYKLSPGLFRANGVTVHVVASGYCSHNANSKVIKIQFGSVANTLISGTTSMDDRKWVFDGYFTRTAQDSQRLTVIAGMTNYLTGFSSNPLEDDGAEIELKFTGAGVADNDIIQYFMMVEVIEPSAGL